METENAFNAWWERLRGDPVHSDLAVRGMCKLAYLDATQVERERIRRGETMYPQAMTMEEQCEKFGLNKKEEE